ncbi:choice-of-anchor M domain-containing protein [Streptomyces sp. PanSC19]|uniref:choice-of-anchor M domain-containing protein n=1 Tax=Streptomyces sp. PanSC19 TaxID=1520455 RepID=UPI0011CEA534|nr:choice-of-anchor M domain-containing protein [Streptomyces sp. PanSC19]
MHTRKRLMAVTGVAATVLAVAGLNSSAFAATTLSTGHVDVMDADWDGAALTLHVHDETNAVEYDPADAVLSVPAAAKTARPTGTQYAFLGTGAQVWVLPQDQAAATAKNVLWPGISTEHLATGVFANDTVQYKLGTVTRDGAATDDFSVYKVNGSTVDRYYDSGTTTSYKTKTFAVGTHDHANWAFEEPGTYKVTFTVTGTVGGVTRSATDTYTVTVTN